MRLAAGLAATLVFLTGGALAASAAPSAPKAYYLALGDSIAYGFQPPTASARPSAVRNGYVDVFAARLRALSPGIRVVNYGCPGESTVTFTKGGCPWLAEKRRLHDSFRGSQLGAALAFLRAHRGQVSPITVSLGGNDLGAVVASCRGSIGCVRKRSPRAVASFGSRLTSILRRLKTAAPEADIIVTGIWNFEVDRLAQTDFLYGAVDKQISRSAARAGARFAATRPLFNPRGSLAAKRARICAYTYGCRDDPHPTNAGYRAIAKAILAASGYS